MKPTKSREMVLNAKHKRVVDDLLEGHGLRRQEVLLLLLEHILLPSRGTTEDDAQQHREYVAQCEPWFLEFIV